MPLSGLYKPQEIRHDCGQSGDVTATPTQRPAALLHHHLLVTGHQEMQSLLESSYTDTVKEHMVTLLGSFYINVHFWKGNIYFLTFKIRPHYLITH